MAAKKSTKSTKPKVVTGKFKSGKRHLSNKSIIAVILGLAAIGTVLYVYTSKAYTYTTMYSDNVATAKVCKETLTSSPILRVAYSTTGQANFSKMTTSFGPDYATKYARKLSTRKSWSWSGYYSIPAGASSAKVMLTSTTGIITNTEKALIDISECSPPPPPTTPTPTPTPEVVSGTTIRYEAESSTTNATPYYTGKSFASGGGVLGYFCDLGKYATFTVNTSVAGNYAVTLNYAAIPPDNNPPPASIKRTILINNSVYAIQDFPLTSSIPYNWDTATIFANKNLGNLPLNAGTNTITIRIDNAACSDLDYLEVTGANATTPAPVPAPAPVPPPTTTPNTSGKFYIVGKDIVAPDGSIFFGIGANVVTYVANECPRLQGGSGGTALGHSNDALAWGWNIVRLNIWAVTPCPGVTQQNVLDGIDAFVNEYTAKGIVVIIDSHENYQDAGGEITSLSDPRIAQSKAFWTVAAARYKNNPYVWYNVMNEFDHAGNTSLWLSLMTDLRNTVRATGAENILLLDLPGWAQGLDVLVNTNIGSVASSQCNVLFDWHNYGALGSTANQESYIQKAQAKGYPLFVGEYGADPFNVYNNVDSQPQMDDNGVIGYQALALKYGIGSTWWHGIGGNNYTNFFPLKNDRTAFWVNGVTGTGLTSYGQNHWNLAKNKPLKSFSGSLASSNCASAQ